MRCVPGEVHVWRIELDCAGTSLSALAAVLSQNERKRGHDCDPPSSASAGRSLVGRLRCILATYARSEPRSLALQAGPHGKPELVGPGQDIPFNLAHTEGLALLAIAGSGRVGSDAEVVRVGIEMEDMSRRFFAPTEADEILALAPEARLAAFFACWTRKEVFVKALGTGLSVPLDLSR